MESKPKDFITSSGSEVYDKANDRDDNMRLTTPTDVVKELKSPSGTRKTEDLSELPNVEIY